MEIKLKLITEDIVNLSIPQKYKEYIKNINNKENQDEAMNKEIEKIIKEELKNNYTFLNDNNKDNYEVKIENKKDSGQKYDCIIEIKSKDKLKEEIEKKINSCKEKEKILMNKQKMFKKMCDEIKIDEKLLENKLTKLSEVHLEDYDKIINQLVSQVLDYNNFKKDVEKIKELIINYRDSLILVDCFKIYLKHIIPSLNYAKSKYIIFLNNEKLFQMLCKILQKINKKITNEIFDSISQKISDNEIYKNHKEEYEEYFLFYKEICYLFPLLKFFDNSQEKEIYELDDDLHLYFSENIYDSISRINSQIPKRKGLNLTLSYFKDHYNIQQGYEMSLRRILLFHKNYKVRFPDFKKSSFLYD